MFNHAVGLLVQPSAQWRKVAKLPADARGSSGFPNLSDSDWIWGGSP